MAIEFRCPQCQKLLRVGDDAAGKQAKCPGCGAQVTVPSATAPPPPTGSPFDGGASDPFGGLPPVPPVGSDNPYAAPLSTSTPMGGVYGRAGGSGPPWERDGASISSLIATIKETFSSPSEFFSTMRQEGGLGAPLLFYTILTLVSVVIAIIAEIAIEGAMMGALAQQPGVGGPPWQAILGGGVIGILLIIVIAAVVLPISAFISAGIFHVALMIFGGANRPFETTFRVYCYAEGSTAIILLIPFCGGYIQAIVALVFMGIGLCYAHNTDGWRAALAVIAPMLCCFIGSFVIVVLIFGLAAAGAAAGGAGGPGGQPQPFDPNQFNIEERWQLLPQVAAPLDLAAFDAMAAPASPAGFVERFTSLPTRLSE